MIINAPNNTNRFELLAIEYLKLLKKGVEAQNILVLVQNSKKKKEFIDTIKKNSPIGSIGELKIYSFYGLVYNTIINYWAIIENSINDNSNRKIIPNLTGLEISQYILKQCIKEVDFKGYNSNSSLLQQLWRRNSLINLNNLSKEELMRRNQILKEPYCTEAGQAINKYKLKTIDYRAFDFIRQINLFEFLYKKLDNQFEYVFLDDGDEITPTISAYLNHIKPSTKEFFIGYDSRGSTRLGYLGAINIDYEKFLNEKAIVIEPQKKELEVLSCIKNSCEIDLDNIKTNSFLKRNDMIDNVVKEIKALIRKDTPLSEIAIITPLADEYLKAALDKTGLKFNYLTKNEKLNQNKLIGYILELLKIINDTDNLDISAYTLKGIFIELLNLDKKESVKIIQQYKLEREFKGINLFEFIKEQDKEEFKQLIDIYQRIRFEKLSVQLVEIVSARVDFSIDNQKNIIKINQLLKQIYDFEEVFKLKVSNLELINQLENSLITENPLSDDEIDTDSIVVSSAQKIIDYSYKVKHQFLLDASNENWIKQDIGPLYNAWVLQKTWSKETFELEDNIELTKDRTARVLYKLYLLTKNTYLYCSVYDSLGVENISGIDKYYKFNKEIEKKEDKKIVPRDDQKEVLNYKGGKLAISAAAGSGKTTILLLLVDKLLEGKIFKNIAPKNIFVLTFMESAARNFKERIKARYPSLGELPSISTIHGLALRIIKENNNYSKLGLDYNFEIIDEIKKSAILSEIISKLNIPKDKQDLYESAISTYKNELVVEKFDCKNKLFMNVYNNYKKTLKEQNLLDYDDLLLLSLKLLQENKDVLDYYKDLVKIIIEDEAQDSSAVQQSLISLLGAKSGNIIRCGDINQAITSTFTNSDVRGFREFIKTSNNVVMDKCQRCATGILDCANETVDWAVVNKIDAFSSLYMKPVEGVNIIDKRAYKLLEFEKEKQESTYIINEVKEILKNDKNATIAILTRSNYAINKWAKLLEDSSIKTYKNSQNLINNSVYRLCLLILEFIKEPFDIKIVQKIALEQFELGFIDYSELSFINGLNKPLFLYDAYDSQLWWDLTYFLYKNHYSIYDLVHEIGSYYFDCSPQKDNIALVATIAKKVGLNEKTFEDTVNKLREIQFKNNFSNIKFFNCADKEKKASRVQIMTLHKSKGDEFDYVFIPELIEDNLCLSIEKNKLKENSKFIQKVKKNPKSDYELKKDIVEENYRLIYVGITRAKKKLYLLAAKEYKYYSQIKKYNKSQIFEGLYDKIN